MYQYVRYVVLSVLFFSLAGCAGFRAGQLPEVQGWPPQAEHKETVSYVVTGGANINGTDVVVQEAALSIWKKAVEQSLRESELFSRISEGASNADIQIDIEVLNNGEFIAPLAFLSGFTFGVIPSFATDTFIVKATFKKADGMVVGAVEKQEAVNTWMHLLLLPLAPFKSPGAEAESVLLDLNKAILLEAKQLGFINK